MPDPTPTNPNTQRSSRGHVSRLAVFLVACIAIPFVLHPNYLHAGFYLDDYSFEQNYSSITWAKLPRFFDPVVMNWFYRPTFLLWYVVLTNSAHHNPIVMHAAGLALYGLTAFGLGTFVFRLTRSSWEATLAAILLLTTNTFQEAVWWISSQSTLLAALLSLATLHLWMTARERSSRRYLVAAYVTMALATCAKEDALTLPFILIVFDLYMVGRDKLAGATPAALSGRAAARSPVLAWAPVLAWMVIYVFLDLTACHHMGLPFRPMWDVGTIPLIASMGAKNLIFDIFGNPFSPVSPAPAFAIGIAVVLWRTRRNPLIFATTVMAVLAVVPMPVTAGPAAHDERFNFMPEMYGILLATVVIAIALESKNTLVRNVGMALMLAALLMRLPHEAGKVAAQLAWSAVAFSFVWLLAPVLRREAALVTTLAMAAVARHQFGMDASLLPPAAIVTVGVIYGAVHQKRVEAVVDGVAIACALSVSASISLPIFLGAAVMNAWANRTDHAVGH